MERQNHDVTWVTADHAARFPISAVKRVEILPTEFMGRRFASIALTFQSSADNLRYQFLTSHVSEADWLIQTAGEIAELLEVPVENGLQSPATH